MFNRVYFSQPPPQKKKNFERETKKKMRHQTKDLVLFASKEVTPPP